MIKATMTCTNCKREWTIPYDELHSNVMVDRKGELIGLCSGCQELWEDTIASFKKNRAIMFTELQEQFGIKVESYHEDK